MAYSGNYDWDEHNRQTVLEGRQILERTSQSIVNSQRIAIETEQIGAGVVSDLSEQRESLLRSKSRLENMDEGLSKSQRIIKQMRKHVLYNKILLILIILLEVGILCGVIYLKFFSR